MSRMEDLTGAELLMARIKECTARDHDGKVFCRACRADMLDLRVLYLLKPDGSPVERRE